jgi:hypothetical protein
MPTFHGRELYISAVAPGVSRPAIGWPGQVRRAGSTAVQLPRAGCGCGWHSVAPSTLANDGGSDPCQPHDGGNDGVGNNGRPIGAGQLES